MGATPAQVKDPIYTPYVVCETRLERAFRRIVENQVPGKASLNVLDYGCGYGIRSEKVVEYLKPRQTSVYLFDVDPKLLTTARERLSKVTQVCDFRSGEIKFDLLLCLGVLEVIPDHRIVAQVLRTFRMDMDRNSLLIIQHTNWHSLAARTVYWFLKSLVTPRTFGSAMRTREDKVGYRHCSTLPALLGMIADAGLKVDKIIPGPYVREIFLPLPLSIRDRNLLLVSARD